MNTILLGLATNPPASAAVVSTTSSAVTAFTVLGTLDTMTLVIITLQHYCIRTVMMQFEFS